MTFVWTLVSFLSGSIPFSMWVGRLALKKDIRQYGDHNPGATNVARAGGWQLGVLAAALDIAKGAAPVWLAIHWLGLDGWSLLPIALAPVLGHAYSPFLKFKGGKAVAVTGGIWMGLLGIGGFLTAVAFLAVWYALLTVDAWSVMFGLFSLLGYLLLIGISLPLAAIWLGNTALVGWKHRAELAQLPHLRPWLKRMVRLS